MREHIENEINRERSLRRNHGAPKVPLSRVHSHKIYRKQMNLCSCRVGYPREDSPCQWEDEVVKRFEQTWRRRTRLKTKLKGIVASEVENILPGQ